MKIKEIMVKDVVTLSADITVKEAMDILFERKISGLPVVDKDRKLLGMFTEKEVISRVLPSYIENVGRFVYDENPKATKKKLKDLSDVKIGTLMRKEVVTTTEDAALCEVARIMLTQKARRIPVLDKAGRVIGIIAREDVLKAFAGEMRDL